MSKERLINRWLINNNQPNIKDYKCKICNTDLILDNCVKFISNDIFYAGPLIRYQCNICKVIFGDLRFLNLNSSEITNDYTDLYSFYKEGDTTIYILKWFNDLLIDKSKSILDYGCGKWNNHIKLLQQKGYNIKGYDAYVGDYNFNLELNSYDVIISHNFIEHVIDPYKDLNNLISYVKKDGLIVFSTACFEYYHEHTHYHTYFFLEESIPFLEKNLNIKLIFTKKYTEYPFTNLDFTIVKVFIKL